eukprot:SAG31_NODE_3706_length_3971_cov_7.584969_5_plen_220_part_00
MQPAPRRANPLLLLLLATLCSAIPCAVATTPADSSGTAAEEASLGLNCVAPSAVAHRVRHLCSGNPVTDALLATGLTPTVADAAADVLRELGFETALDLRLLVGQQQLQDELAAELKTSGLSIGDRTKIQLLVGDGGGADPRGRLEGGTSAFACVKGSTQCTELINGGAPISRRQQQTEGDDGGLSTDTLAIVLSVLVGAAGCESPFVGCNAIGVSVGG